MTQFHYTDRFYIFLRKLIVEHLSVPFHRNTYFYSANLLVTFISGVVFWMIAARLMTPADVGTANAFLAPTAFLATLFLLGTNHGILRFSNEVQQDQRILYSALWITLGVSIVGAIIGAIIVLGGKIVSPMGSSIIFSIVIYIIVVSGNIIWTICEAVFIGLRAPLQLLIRNIGFGVIRILILIPFSYLGEIGLVISYAAGLGIASALSIDLIRRYLKTTRREFFTLWHDSVKKISRFALPNHIANLISSVPAMLLPLIVFRVLGADINGYFSIAWLTTMVARSVLTASSATLLSEGSRDSSLLERKLTKTLTFLTIIILLSIAPMVFFPRLVMLPFGRAYAVYNASVLPILAVSILPSIITTVFVASERINNRSHFILLFAITNGVLSSVIPYFGARDYGYLGFAVAYLISQFILGVLAIPPLIHSFLRSAEYIENI
jgi:O-antigen/teichoic acid export membrane protein